MIYDVLRKWGVGVSVIVIVIAITIGATFQATVSLLPEDQQETLLPYVIATSVVVILGNAIIAVMQWFGVSPLDFLPELTLDDRLRQLDPTRFKMSKIKDSELLAEQARSAKKLKQYDWGYLFAQAWENIQPNNIDALELLGECLIELGDYEEAINIGNEITKLEKLNHNGYSIIGNGFFRKSNFAEALQWYKKSYEVVPRNFKQFVLYDLIETNIKLGNVNEAIQNIEEVIPLLDMSSKEFYDDKLADLKEIKVRQED